MLQMKESSKASEKISKTEIRTQPDKEFKELAIKMLKLGRISEYIEHFNKNLRNIKNQVDTMNWETEIDICTLTIL